MVGLAGTERDTVKEMEGGGRKRERASVVERHFPFPKLLFISPGMLDHLPQFPDPWGFKDQTSFQTSNFDPAGEHLPVARLLQRALLPRGRLLSGFARSQYRARNQGGQSPVAHHAKRAKPLCSSKLHSNPTTDTQEEEEEESPPAPKSKKDTAPIVSQNVAQGAVLDICMR